MIIILVMNFEANFHDLDTNSTDSVLSQTGYNSEINYSACSILSRRNNSWCTRIYKHERLITFIYTNYKTCKNVK
jgi:hypothetical protein